MPNYLRAFRESKMAQIRTPALFLLVFLFSAIFPTSGMGSPIASSDPCLVPSSGDWIVNASCTISGTKIAPASVSISTNVLVTVAPNSQLLIDFKNSKLLVKKGGGLLVKKSATVRQVKVADLEPAYKLKGVNFSPWIEDQSPDIAGVYASEEQIRSRLAIISKHTEWIRTFGADKGLENICRIAKTEFNLKCAMGAWISNNTEQNNKQVDAVAAEANKGYVDIAVIGNEYLQGNNTNNAAPLINSIQRFRGKASSTPVTTVDTYNKLMENSHLLQYVDIVMVNVYPFWNEKPIEEAMGWTNTWYEQLKAKSGNKTVWIAEAGWPSGGTPKGKSIPSPENASYHFLNFVSWARAKNIPYFYFEAFDEPWKVKNEGPVGEHWGIWDKDGVMKPGMQTVFDGTTIPDNWTWNNLPGGPGTPDIQFTYMPPWGSAGAAEGQVLHIAPNEHKVLVYIYVGNTWWVKPYAATPLSDINVNGLWSANIVTYYTDVNATKIAAFIVPNGFVSNVYYQYNLPQIFYTNSKDYVEISRTQGSITGTVLDQAGQPVAGASVTLQEQPSITATTNQNGKYSFYNIPNSGTYTVVPSKTFWTFSPVQTQVTVNNTNTTADFTGTSNR